VKNATSASPGAIKPKPVPATPAKPQP